MSAPTNLNAAILLPAHLDLPELAFSQGSTEHVVAEASVFAPRVAGRVLLTTTASTTTSTTTTTAAILDILAADEA